MRVLIKRPNEKSEIIEIENDLKSLQNLVQGHIEVVTIPYLNDVVFICNEEGKLKNLPINFYTDCDTIVGNVIFTSTSGEDFCSLSDSQINEIKFLLGESK